MNQAVMQLKIERSKQQKKLSELKIKILRILNELAINVNPYFDEIEEIKAVEIEQAAEELLDAKTEAMAAEKRLKQLQHELGE